ncbi:MAG: YHS domain-containing protein [Steroidobacteraceae bacterium]|jgi:YHS domain-containing protein|nr:YHS domain-containing protein [Steroidobacteraceae bacterium]
MVKDPVCGKDVDDQKINEGESFAGSGAHVTDPSFGTKRFHDGKWYYFCSMACRQRFIANPARYLTPDK